MSETNKEYDENSYSNNEKEDSSVDPNEIVLNNEYGYENGGLPLQVLPDYEAIGQKYELQPNQLSIIKPIGKGYYSDVHMGILSLPTEDIPVAVKTSQIKTGSINDMERNDILKLQRKALRDELNIFAHIQSNSEGGHENVLKLVGAITTIQSDFCIITEYCECGSVDRFIQNKWKNGKFKDELILKIPYNEKIWKIENDPCWSENFRVRREHGLITTSDLLWFALQIANAMQFLAENNVIHRDVALRNVLLKSDFTIKVADFGLSRKLRQTDDAYYVWKHETALPIRYLAPESLKYGRFATTSELWSFGVVVWELFTFAENQPYSVEFNNYEGGLEFRDFLVEHLSAYHRLSVPNNVPTLIMRLLSGLWHPDPKERPSFQVCKDILIQELKISCPEILLHSKVSVHARESALFDIENKSDYSEVSKNWDWTPTVSYISAFTLENQLSTDTSKKKRKNFKRRVIVGVGFVAVIFIAVALVLDITGVFAKTLPVEMKSIANNTDNIFHQESSPITGNMNDVWLRSAVEEEEADRRLKNIFAYLSSQTTCINQSNNEVIDSLKRAAEQGEAQAQGYLGKMFHIGKCVNQSDEEAVKWYRKAAEQGNAIAQVNLGLKFEQGLGINHSYVEAEKWFKKAAEQGVLYGLNSLKILHDKIHDIVPRSDVEAFRWYKKAAEQGSSDAQYKLGFMYYGLRGVNESNEEAVKWYWKAAEQGNADGQYNLAYMYQRGLSVPQSYKDAVKWYRKSAEQGNAIGQYNLGFMYDNGWGVAKSCKEAVKWYKKAAEQGDVAAKSKLQEKNGGQCTDVIV